MNRDRRSLPASYRSAAAWIIVVAIAMLAGHLFRVQSPQGRTPFLSANDRSRWATVRALLEHGTFALDDVSFTTRLPEDDGGKQPPRAKRDAEWHSIDMVRHRGADGREHYYSSKPPLLATMVAGVCRIVEWATGARLADNPKYVGRLTLVCVNLVPLAVAWWLLARMLAFEARTHAGRTFVLATAAFGTLLGPMAVTLNNHVPAAVATQIAVFALWQLLRGLRLAGTERTAPGLRGTGLGEVDDGAPSSGASSLGWLGTAWAVRGWRERLARGNWTETGWCVATGGAAAFATAFELPALSLLASLGFAIAVVAPRGLLGGFLPAVAVVGAIAIGLNYAAHGEWRPAYANRADGPVIATIEETPWRASTNVSARVAPALRDVLREAGIEVSARATHRPVNAAATGATATIAADTNAANSNAANSNAANSNAADTKAAARWTLWDPETHRRWAVVATDGGWECREWRNWYDYEGTYWTPERLRGVDRGEPSRVAYLFHATLGHHGVLSVTPVWLLSVVGGWLAWRRGSWPLRLLAALAALLTVVCMSFYVARPLIDRNYGGVSCGFRWLFWLIPLWCLPMAAAADSLLRSRWGRFAAAGLLGASVFSAAWSATKPWSHPWIYEYWASLGWLGEM